MHARKNLIPSVIRIMATLYLLFSSHLSEAESEVKNTNLDTISKKTQKEDHAEYEENHAFVVKRTKSGNLDETFKEFECAAIGEGYYKGKCVPHAQPDGKILVEDCVHHDQVDWSCRLVRLNSNGVPDPGFSSPFSSTYPEFVGSPENEIKDIYEVDTLENGNIRIKGSFISPLVGWTQEQASKQLADEYEGIGANKGKEAVVVLDKNGKFLSATPTQPGSTGRAH